MDGILSKNKHVNVYSFLKSINLPWQLISSVLSTQSSTPLHLWLLWMHLCTSHINSSEAQSVKKKNNSWNCFILFIFVLIELLIKHSCTKNFVLLITTPSLIVIFNYPWIPVVSWVQFNSSYPWGQSLCPSQSCTSQILTRLSSGQVTTSSALQPCLGVSEVTPTRSSSKWRIESSPLPSKGVSVVPGPGTRCTIIMAQSFCEISWGNFAYLQSGLLLRHQTPSPYCNNNNN